MMRAGASVGAATFLDHLVGHRAQQLKKQVGGKQ